MGRSGKKKLVNMWVNENALIRVKKKKTSVFEAIKIAWKYILSRGNLNKSVLSLRLAGEEGINID